MIADFPWDAARQHHVRVTPRWPAVEIKVTGNRDPRGPDNSVLVWLDEQDRLHIAVYKAERCYKFTEMLNERGFVEIVQA
jgi:hypothetical protein